jgi:hypothetical protein
MIRASDLNIDQAVGEWPRQSQQDDADRPMQLH